MFCYVRRRCWCCLRGLYKTFRSLWPVIALTLRRQPLHQHLAFYPAELGWHWAVEQAAALASAPLHTAAGTATVRALALAAGAEQRLTAGLLTSSREPLSARTRLLPSAAAWLAATQHCHDLLPAGAGVATRRRHVHGVYTAVSSRCPLSGRCRCSCCCSRSRCVQRRRILAR